VTVLFVSPFAFLGPLGRFLAFVFRRFPMMQGVLLLTLLLLLLEYAVFSLMIPLAMEEGASDGGTAEVTRLWVHAATALGLPPVRMTWLWLFLLLLGLRTTLGYVHVLQSTWVAKQVHRHLSERTFHNVIVEEPMTQIYKRSIGYYLTLAGDDTFRAGTIVLSTSQTLANLTSVGVGFFLLYLFSPTVLGWTLAFLTLCAVAVGLAFQVLLRANEQSVQMSNRARTTFVEALNSLRSVRSMNAETFVVRGYGDQIRHYVRLLFEIEAIRAGMKFLPGAMALFAGALALWPGTTRIEGVTAGYFFAATTLLIRVFVSLGAFIHSSTMLLTDARAVKDLAALIGTDRQPPARPADRHGCDQSVSQIDLRGIRYGYRDGVDVLRDLNFSFQKGQVVAVVGPSGSGKSTLADLMLGLVEAHSGSIVINGGALGTDRLGPNVVLVEQQARIFSASVRENVLLGSQHDDERIWAVLRLVDLEPYVTSLPKGLDSEFDYQGANLSGGQRQRLSIARALIREPQVLILDEATSALDPATRDTVIERVRDFMRDGIVILITHDETLAALSDLVLSLMPQQIDERPSPTP
jgi:ATP-binding cassette subfamily B protein